MFVITSSSSRDIDEDVQSVKQFTSELIVEAVVRCLRVIDPALGNGLTHSLPPGMSARFRLGMSLAQACQVRDTVPGRHSVCRSELDPSQLTESADNQ